MGNMYQRADTIAGGITPKSNDRSEGGTLRVARRGVRRFGRISRRRLSVCLLLIGATFFMYMTFIGLKVHFHGEKEDGISSFSNVQDQATEKGILTNVESEKEDSLSSFSNVHDEATEKATQTNIEGQKGDRISSFSETLDKATEINVMKKKKSRKHYPCDVEFAKSVEYILEPKDFLNFTHFALEYVEKEDKSLIKSPNELKFGGHQSLEEREKSFYARNQTLHCGFVKGPDGIETAGFDLDEKDKRYMSSCVIVVSSCIFGSSDFLRRPTSRLISEYSKTNVCFVMFLDEQTLLKLSSEGNVPDDRGHLGLWRIVVVKNLPYEDMRRTGKVPKLLAHRLFPSSRYSIWLDSKMRLNADPLLILEYFLWRTRSEYAISQHYDRRCVWEEVLQNKRLNKYNHTAIDEQFLFYQSDGLTKFDASDPHVPLPSYVPEGSFIVRAHTPMSNLFSCLWFNEVDRFTSRDQLSFAYTYLKLKRMNPDKPFFLNMFKDCERRALVKLFRHREVPPPPPPS